jgi:polar amino acid transport system substrate-binding protein
VRRQPRPRQAGLTRAVATTVLTALAVVMSGCGVAAPNVGDREVGFTPPEPVGAKVLGGPTTTTTGPPPPDCGDATASLSPTGSPPPPGQMPQNSTMASIVASGRLRVGVDQNSYLFGFRNSFTGELEGFDIDIARQMAAALFGDQDKIQFVTLNSADRIPALKENRVDIVVRTMTINCARKKEVDFSTVYYQSGQRVLVHRGSGYTDLNSLRGRRVCAAAGSTSIDNLARAPSQPVPVAVAGWTDCLVMLQQGQVDAISTDDNILAGLAAQDPYAEVVGPRFTNEPYGIAVAQKHEDLVRFINAVLEQMRSDGTWTRIYQRWLTELGPAPAPPTARYQP